MTVKRKKLFGKITQKVLLYINIFAAVSLFIAFFSVHISPQKAWPVAFFGLAFPYFLAINIFFVILWGLLFKRYFLISLVVILISWPRINDFSGISSNKKVIASSGNDIKVMTYNVRMFDYYHWSKVEGAGSARKMIRFIQEQKPDILCLQEFYIPKKDMDITIHSIKSELDWMNYQHIDYINNFLGGMYGVATFSRYPILNKGNQEFDNSVNRVIFTDVLIGNDTIRVFNNHLQSFRLTNNNFKFIENLRFEYSDKQLEEAKDLSKRLRNAYITRSKQVDIVSEMIRGAPHDVIVCGDFNDTPVSYTYHQMKVDLTDSFVTCGKGIGVTYHAKTPGFRIDYIFYGERLSCSGYKRHRVMYSDHYPISAIIHSSD